MGREWESKYVKPGIGNGNGNEPLRMGGHGIEKVIPAHLYITSTTNDERPTIRNNRTDMWLLHASHIVNRHRFLRHTHSASIPHDGTLGL